METSGTRRGLLSERELQFLQLHQWLNSPGVTSRSWWHGNTVTQAEGWPVFAQMEKSQKKDVCSKTKPGCQVDVNIFKYYIYLIYYIIYVTIREISHRYEFYEIDDNMIFGYVWASLVGVFPAIWRLINVKTKTCTSTSSLVVHTADGWEIRLFHVFPIIYKVLYIAGPRWLFGIFSINSSSGFFKKCDFLVVIYLLFVYFGWIQYMICWVYLQSSTQFPGYKWYLAIPT